MDALGKRMAERTAQHRLTLRFLDAELERDFMDALAAQAQPTWRILMPAILVLWLVVCLIDEQLGGSAENAIWLITLRVAVTPAVLLCVAVSFARPSRFARFWQPTSLVMGAALMGAVIAMWLFAPQPELFDAESHTGGMLVLIITGYTVFFVRWSYLALLSVPMTTLDIATTAAFAPSHAPIAATWLCTGTVVGLIGAISLERTRRKAFLANRLLDAERARSEELLHNMVPRSIATRLKTNGERIADAHDEVTVLFADIVGFSPLAARIEPSELVSTLDGLFSKFDEHVDRLRLEKIKTVGDEYMVVGGAPQPRPDHAPAIADLGEAMLETVASHAWPDGTRLSLRIGIHTGPAIGGVIGKRKLTYDLWGDTVNVASRMESHGITGRVHVSAATAARLRDTHDLEERGLVSIKGIGEMLTYLLVGRREIGAPLREARSGRGQAGHFVE